VRFLKKISDQALFKKYIYHDQLQFLLKIIETNQTASSLDESVPECVENNRESLNLIEDSTDAKVLSKRKFRECKRKLDEKLDRETWTSNLHKSRCIKITFFSSICISILKHLIKIIEHAQYY